MNILITLFCFIGFVWLTFLIAFVLCFYKHINKPEADCLIDEIDSLIKELGGYKDEHNE